MSHGEASRDLAAVEVTPDETSNFDYLVLPGVLHRLGVRLYPNGDVLLEAWEPGGHANIALTNEERQRLIEHLTMEAERG